ncbi:MAG TPA: hypothetical protein VHT29_15305, partial [Solirubrobacteraceae bacterium]|nr:hypothetical protein [Solirubrobacteraceae bacterium]
MVAQRMDALHPLEARHARIVGERHVDSLGRQLAGNCWDVIRRRVHDHADVRLGGVDVNERVDVEHLRRHRAHL